MARNTGRIRKIAERLLVATAMVTLSLLALAAAFVLKLLGRDEQNFITACLYLAAFAVLAAVFTGLSLPNLVALVRAWKGGPAAMGQDARPTAEGPCLPKHRSGHATTRKRLVQARPADAPTSSATATTPPETNPASG